MAKVTRQRKQEVVILEMSLIEAVVLGRVLAHVGGSPDGPRGMIDNINAALDAGGVIKFGCGYPAAGSVNLPKEHHHKDKAFLEDE